MFKVLIADDEKYICALIRSLIDWKTMDMELIGEANDGVTALDMILKQNPDIVIIDIKMPEMDGLEVIQKAKTQHTKSEFILISGYREFEYAYTAIKSGVGNYLLKPISKEELFEVLQKTIQLIENNYENEMRDVLEIQKKEYLQQIFLKDLIFHKQNLKEKTTEDLKRKYFLDFPADLYQLIALQPDAKIQLDSIQYGNMLREINSFFMDEIKEEYEDVFATQTSSTLFYLLRFQEIKDSEKLLQKFEKTKIKFYPFCNLTLGKSTICKSVLEVNPNEAMEALFYRLMLGNNHIFEYGTQAFEKNAKTIHYTREEIWDLVSVPNLDKMKWWFGSRKDVWSKFRGNPIKLVKACSVVLDLWVKKLGECVDNDYISALKEKFEKVVFCSDTREKLIQNTCDLLCRSISFYEKKQKEENSSYVRIAKEYVQTYYMKNIRLEDISKITYLNPTYFSILFKQETGENFTDYLTGYRMKKAKELLKDFSYSIAEVGEAVGYLDTRYFSKVFKKRYGIKPSEYRKLY